MKYYLFALYLLFMSEWCPGQVSELFSFNGNYLTVGVSFPFVKYLDKGYSPNLYKGKSGLMISVSLLHCTSNIQSRFSVTYVASTLQNRRKDISYSSKSSYDNFLMKYALGFLAYNSEHVIYYVGPSIAFGFSSNQYENLKSNNAYAYHGRISLGFEGSGFYSLFSRQEQVLLNSTHNLSLLTWSSRPSWTTMMPFEGIQPKFSPGRLLAAGKLLTLDRFIDFGQNIGLCYKDDVTRNFAGVQHQYDYTRNTAAPHHLYTGNQSIGVFGGLIYR